MLELLRKAVLFSHELRHIFIVTADVKGLPHVAVGGGVNLCPEGLLHVTG